MIDTINWFFSFGFTLIYTWSKIMWKQYAKWIFIESYNEIRWKFDILWGYPPANCTHPHRKRRIPPIGTSGSADAGPSAINTTQQTLGERLDWIPSSINNKTTPNMIFASTKAGDSLFLVCYGWVVNTFDNHIDELKGPQESGT